VIEVEKDYDKDTQPRTTATSSQPALREEVDAAPVARGHRA